MKLAKGSSFIARYFDPSLDLRVQAFHLLAFAGMAAGVITALSALFTHAGAANIILNLIGTGIGLGCLVFARRTNNYRAGFVVAVVLTFLILFTLLFFSSGGYRSGMPSFFVFALMFTAIMLEGKIRAAFIAGDMLKRAIGNLLSNAAGHTMNGKITVSLNREGGSLITAVADTGEGIDPAMLSRIFERGVSGRGTTGYGLSICKAIIEAHGGEIDIGSEAGKGTTARFALPIWGVAQ